VVKVGDPSVSSNAESESISAVSAVFGANEWLVDELYEQFLKDKNAVDPAWWEFFESYTPGEETSSGTASGASEKAPTTAAPAAAPKPAAGDARPPQQRAAEAAPGHGSQATQQAQAVQVAAESAGSQVHA